MPPKGRKAYDAFLEDISSKLFNYQGHTSRDRIAEDQDFRLDMQTLTTKTKAGDQYYNLQVQIQGRTSVTSLKKLAPGSVGTVLVHVDATPTEDELKQAFKDSYNETDPANSKKVYIQKK